MSHAVLLFDPDAVSLAAMRDVLTKSRCQVTAARAVADVAALAPATKWDVAVIDLLSDTTSGLQVLRLVQRQRHPPASIVTLRFGYEHLKAEAKALGALDYIEQPITSTLLTTVVHVAAAFPAANETVRRSDVIYHSLSRWTDVVVRSIDCHCDPKTLGEWGRAVAVSTGTLRNWCRTARLPARGSLLFARTLRAVVRQSGTRGASDLLNVVDRRTLAKILVAAGGDSTSLPTDVESFLTRQRFIQNRSAIAIVAQALESRGRVVDMSGIRITSTAPAS